MYIASLEGSQKESVRKNLSGRDKNYMEHGEERWNVQVMEEGKDLRKKGNREITGSHYLKVMKTGQKVGGREGEW